MKQVMRREWFIPLLLAILTMSGAPAETRADRVLLPIEVMGEAGTTVSETVSLTDAQSESVRSLWLHVHGLRYSEQASVQVNTSPWIPIKNDTVAVAEPGKAFGGIGGGFRTLVLTLPLINGTVLAGTNIIRFRFNQSDGLASGYRVLAWNFLTAAGSKVLPATIFVEDLPESWIAPRPDAASIRAGQELWHTAALLSSSLPNSPRLQARCADCHAVDGRDLKYFNFSNTSIVARSLFHGLTTLQGEQIASYIRSLPVPNPGRPWNPPYQPGPQIDEQPISHWAAGAGLEWILEQDTNALPYLLVGQGKHASSAALHAPLSAFEFRHLATQITPDIFHPDGNLNPREVPIALQLPDWSEWLPRVHPKDAWGSAFVGSELATIYDGGVSAQSKPHLKPQASLRALLTSAQTQDHNFRSITPMFARWSQSRRTFLGRLVKTRTVWSVDLTNKVYSTQLWQLVKTWEMMQEFGLEGRGPDLFGATTESRTWCNTIPVEAAPVAANIPSGSVGVGGSALTNEYLSASWYELQIILNSGNHRHRDRTPVDWVYLISQFRDLYSHSRFPEPVRLLVAVTKALQSTDPRLGPGDYRQGWRPDRNIDPRIMISTQWAPFLKPFPLEVRRALTESLLAAWIDKNLQYPITEYLPLMSLRYDYTPRYASADISGGKVWEAAPQFRAAGVSDELVERLQSWGLAYTDRAARLQYH